MRDPSTIALEVLKTYWGEGDYFTLPVDPVIIARSIGINVYKTDLEPGTSGYIVKRGPGVAPDIFFNSEHAPVRQRFTTAHELGHYFYRRENDNVNADEYVLRRDALAACGTDTEEIWANAFAAALLMPKKDLELLVDLGFENFEIAKQFMVSLESLGLRRKKLGL